MSKLVYEGDTTINFGEYLPAPYIDQVVVDTYTNSDFSTDRARIEIELYLLVKVTEEADEGTLIENLKKFNFYWIVGLGYTPEDYPNQFILDYGYNGFHGDVATWFNLSTLAVDGTNGFIANSDGTDVGYDVMYDENGDRILKFTYKGQHDSLETWSTYDTYDDIYVYAFSTAEDFTEDYWTTESDAAYAGSWTQFLKTEISDISYEPVLDSGDVVQAEEVVWIDNDEAVYGKTPLQSIQGAYYKIDKLTHEQIVSSFQSLLDEYQDASATDAELLDTLNNISYILITYGEAVDLLPQLNEYRNAFPSKTSATVVGQLYRKYRKKIVSANEVTVLAERLHKRVVTGNKIIDLRVPVMTEYTPPVVPDDKCTVAPECGDCEVLKFKVSPLGEPIMNRNVWTHGLLGDEGSIDEGLDYGSTYGWFFFDYDKAFYYTSYIASAMNVKKLIRYFEPALFNINYTLKSVSLIREDARGPTGGALGGVEMVTTYTYDNNYPEVVSTTVSDLGGNNEPIYGVYTADSSFNYTIAHDFLLLRYYNSNEDNYPYINERYATDDTSTGPGDWGYVDAGAFRLMAFEFQDLMTYDDQAELPTYSYTATVTMEDNTAEVVTAVMTSFGDLKTIFDEYYDSAKEICSWNSIDNTFNQFFIDQMEELYGANLTTSPWIKASSLYHYFIDILYDVYQGDADAIKAAAAETAYNISPITGNIPQLDLFYDQLGELNTTIEAMEADATAAAGVTEYIFECTVEADDMPSLYQLPVDDGTFEMVYARDWDIND